MDAPQLPQQVSSDGREVWAWAERLSEYTQRADKMRQLREAIFMAGRACGDCSKWMKSRECPKERNVNGQTRGPSCKAPICADFVMCLHSAKLRDERQTELTALEASTLQSKGG